MGLLLFVCAKFAKNMNLQTFSWNLRIFVIILRMTLLALNLIVRIEWHYHFWSDSENKIYVNRIKIMKQDQNLEFYSFSFLPKWCSENNPYIYIDLNEQMYSPNWVTNY